MQCPDCQGPVYDNREKNKGRVAAGENPMPEYACRDSHGCGWRKWPPKQASRGKHAPVAVVAIPKLYGDCLEVAIGQLAELVAKHPKAKLPAPEWENVIAAAATVFIQACRQGGLGDG